MTPAELQLARWALISTALAAFLAGCAVTKALSPTAVAVERTPVIVARIA